ncbi:uncharacterized protein DNG_07611 [Cephalotrichum gorgonifer]|uniref:Zf-C3HC domain-containing protein n=1 Tax=Cephalotrichum gorgonifer TaxID=2041049 RepID=A0AAE8N1Z2_9PEZI|nr:uncharacterized protein DNG_07611 [Cephalotrichum gorgonifer]
MNSTKRKFNSLIQGIGNRSSTPGKPADNSPDNSPANRSTTTTLSPRNGTPTSKTTTDADLLAKRRRMGIPGSTPPAAASSSISSVVMSKWSGKSSRPSTPAQPKYCPTDRKELLRRLVTFQDFTDWAPKPDRVGEIEWAKRGWVCQGKERVRCVLCNKELVVKLNKKEVGGKEVSVLVPSEIEDALVNKYVELIVESHHEDCLWRKRGCDDSLLRISFSDATANLESLRARYDELCSRKAFLPYEFNLKLPEDLDMTTVLAQLPDTFFTNPPPEDPSWAESPSKVALALALMGWQGLSNARIGAVPNSASCHTCQRRLGLWMFKSKEVGPNNEVIVPAPMDSLDPIKEHRFFCPWKNAQSQRLVGARPNREADLPAWEMLARSLRNEAYLRGVLDGPPKKARGVAAGVDGAPATPTRGAVATPRTPGTPDPGIGGFDSPLAATAPDGEEDDAARDAKDKERWARLRRVKSLFDPKGSRKLRKTTSRPGTAVSSKSTTNQ